jgi:hypothetical protein
MNRGFSMDSFLCEWSKWLVSSHFWIFNEISHLCLGRHCQLMITPWIGMEWNILHILLPTCPVCVANISRRSIASHKQLNTILWAIEWMKIIRNMITILITILMGWMKNEVGFLAYAKNWRLALSCNDLSWILIVKGFRNSTFCRGQTWPMDDIIDDIVFNLIQLFSNMNLTTSKIYITRILR